MRKIVEKHFHTTLKLSLVRCFLSVRPIVSDKKADEHTPRAVENGPVSGRVVENGNFHVFVVTTYILVWFNTPSSIWQRQRYSFLDADFEEVPALMVEVACSFNKQHCY